MPQSNSSFNEELSYNYNVLKKSTDIEITTPWQRKVDHEIWWKEKKLQLVLNNSNKKSSNPRKTLLTEQEKVLLVKVDQWVRCYSRLKEGRFYINGKTLETAKTAGISTKKNSAKGAKGKKDRSILRLKIELDDFEHHVSCLTFLQKLIPKFQLSH